MRTPLRLAPLLLALAVAAAAGAAPPDRIPYQGLLLDPNGIAVNGSVDVAVAIWDGPSAGTVLYSETHTAVLVTDGVFHVVLGDGSGGGPVPFDPSLFAGDRWVALTIEGEGLEPRQQFLSTVYALRAAVAERLTLQCNEGDLVGYQDVGGQPGLACIECFPADTQVCYEGPPPTQNVGECQDGLFSCIAGQFAGPCTGQVLPATEVCGNGDEDCDGVTDPPGLPGCTVQYVDADGDAHGDSTDPGACLCPGTPGFAPVNDDCDDADANAHPGQTAFFTTPTVGGGFDYNCNSVEEPKFDGGGCCPFNGGFIGPIPSCGVVGDLLSQCGLACEVTTTPRAQECR